MLQGKGKVRWPSATMIPPRLHLLAFILLSYHSLQLLLTVGHGRVFHYIEYNMRAWLVDGSRMSRSIVHLALGGQSSRVHEKGNDQTVKT